MSHLKALQDWYALMSDGDWEHEFGVSVDTIDNPGWTVSIDLERTPLEGRGCDVEMEYADGEWLHIVCDGKRFKAACGPRSLDRAIATFLWFADLDSELTSQQRAERGARGEPVPSLGNGDRPDPRSTAGARSSRDLFSVAKGGVQDKSWFLTVTEDADESFVLRLESPAGQFWEAAAPDAWHALRALREQVEPLGYRLCCAGARVDAYVSGMSISMSAGSLVYLLHRWRKPRSRHLVEIFSYAPPGKVGSVAEQDRFFEEWRRRWWMRIF
ncbi:immunity 53 family protein [Promicromonospora sp. NPDC060204]|uniref:immunity 53 family protein n=1 Tax=Promicromonospora sp. NPDC060204 TaxID=3347071 RepID=UPI0036568456